MKNLNDIPKVGDEVMVWPAMRTVRDEKGNPVVDGKGVVQKIAARVRDLRGVLITSPVPVRVNSYYFKSLVNGNLDWSTKADYQASLVANAKAATKPATPEPAAEPAPAADETTHETHE